MSSSLPPAVVGPEPTDNDTFKNHPWTTERAKVAAETEISPPISPKQHAHQAGFVEPLQESNLTSSHHDNGEHTLTHTWSSLDTFTLLASSSLAPETHFSSSSSSSSSSSFASSNSSTTSLSSAASDSKPSSTLTKLEIIDKRPDLHHLDTPPSSRVPSPSSSSHPSFGLPDTLLDTKTLPSTLSPPPTAPTTIARPTATKTPSVISKNSKTATQIIREISDLVDGRDKTIKVIQYFAKVFLWFFLSNPKQYELLASRIKALAKQFSTTRKVLRLGHFIDPMATVLHMGAILIHNVQKQGWKSTLAKKPDASWRNTVRERLGDMNNAIGFVQDISDDIYCLGVIGVLDRSFADKAEPWSNRLWMVGVSIDLHENLQSIWDVKQQIKSLQGDDEKIVIQRSKLENKLHWLQVTTVKLSGDFLFCAYDNLHCSFSDGFQAVTGFVSGLAGAYKFVGKLAEA
ncbi:Peroxisomal membrane protein PMP27 [Podila epicladia]|nr:Peroxisomal membrane protein PMP27 [Podila epicladia]KAG0099547.1 Peroxisomal membrane protein PMP27 [Podila epicladia]